ncbi:MAG: hypothetical protein NVS1B7_3990 [Candidatus Saccharimonadales bacterium]
MNLTNIATGIGLAILAIVVLIIFIKKWPRRLKSDAFATKWKGLQVLCKEKATWPEALSEADKLLDRALRRRKFKGKSMGERLVSAQRSFTNNDGVWFAHNMCKKVIADPEMRLREDDVKAALVGFRQALRDIGALKSKSPTEPKADGQ